MEEVGSQMGEMILGIIGAIVVLGAVTLLFSDTDVGMLRKYIILILENAC